MNPTFTLLFAPSERTTAGPVARATPVERVTKLRRERFSLMITNLLLKNGFDNTA